MLLFCPILSSADSFTADLQIFDCVTADGRSLTFSYSLARSVVTISKNTSIPGQLLENVPYGFKEQSDFHFTFDYRWYFTGEGSFNFSEKPIWQYKKGDQTKIVVSYDDGDGSGLEPTPFSCEVLQ